MKIMKNPSTKNQISKKFQSLNFKIPNKQPVDSCTQLPYHRQMRFVERGDTNVVNVLVIEY